MSVWCPHSAQRTIWPSVIRLRTSAVWYYRTIIQSGGRYNVRGICFQQLVRSSSRGANFSGLCSSVGMECACGRITPDPWTLAKVRGARSISSLSPRTYLYCFHVLVVDRKWIGHLGFLFVSAIDVDDLGILITYSSSFYYCAERNHCKRRQTSSWSISQFVTSWWWSRPRSSSTIRLIGDLPVASWGNTIWTWLQTS